MNEHRVDRKANRIQVSAEQARITDQNRVRLQHEREQLRLQRERQKLLLSAEKKKTRADEKAKRRIQRQEARQKLAAKIQVLMPTVGRRVMIAGPILAPMAVAWVGQIQFADQTLGWPLAACLVFAAAWELTTAFSGWMFHQAQKDGDRGALFRVSTWIFAASAGAMNYWHACPINKTWTPAGGFKNAIDLTPTPKAISYGAMSLVGIALWELYSSLIHRKHLREQGIVSSARPRFGILRWARYPRITWTAWSLAVRYGIKTVDEAWSSAVAEIGRRQRAKDNRSDVRVTVVRTVVRTVPPPKTTLRLYRVEHPDLHWGPANGSERLALNGSQTGPSIGSESGPTDRSQTQTSGGSETRTGTQTQTGPESGSETQVSQNDGTRSETSAGNETQTGPKRRSRNRSKTRSKKQVPDRIAEAKAADKAYLAEHGRHIPAEKLARALGIGKPAALDLVKQVRGGHIDVAK